MKWNEMNSYLEWKLETETLFIFYQKYLFIHWSINDNYLVKKCLNFRDFLKLNKMKWIVHDFWLLFIINDKQIEPNLNGAFANKYDKIQCWLRNFENLWDFMNSLISLLRIFVYIPSIWKKISAFGFFCLVRKSSKPPSIFLSFKIFSQ